AGNTPTRRFDETNPISAPGAERSRFRPPGLNSVASSDFCGTIRAVSRSVCKADDTEPARPERESRPPCCLPCLALLCPGLDRTERRHRIWDGIKNHPATDGSGLMVVLASIGPPALFLTLRLGQLVFMPPVPCDAACVLAPALGMLIP